MLRNQLLTALLLGLVGGAVTAHAAPEAGAAATAGGAGSTTGSGTTAGRAPTAGADRVAHPAEIDWSSDFAGALQRSPGRARPILVDVGAAWCNPCRLMQELTFRDAGVVDAAAAYATVAVDVDEQGALVSRLGVRRLPTLLFFDGRGDELLRLSGYVPPRRLHRIMETIAHLLAAARPNAEIRRRAREL